LITLEFTNYTVIKKSRKGTGFDYWIGNENDETDIFAESARLEVSGIKNPRTEADFENRVREKVRQVKPTDNIGLPAYIIVTDFKAPKTRVVLK
jgi:hypothetical protein